MTVNSCIWWKRFCALQRYAFFRTGDGSGVAKVKLDTGNHIAVDDAQELFDDMTDEINALKKENAELASSLQLIKQECGEILEKLDS